MTEVDTIEAAIQQIARGGVVIVLDAPERENEGDFLAAADLITPETIHFMTTHGRGHLCLPILPSTARRLDVHPLLRSTEPDAPCFAMPLDARKCGSGVSPVDRALTIQTIVDPTSCPSDFDRPGHVFPLIAAPGGVLQRAGHTESAVDLATLAGRPPAGVLCEICSGDGRTMAGWKELQTLSERFDLPIVTIDALIEYRRSNVAEMGAMRAAVDLVGDVSSVAAPSHSPSTMALLPADLGAKK